MLQRLIHKLRKSNLNDAIDLRGQLYLITILVAINPFLKPLRRILKSCTGTFYHGKILTFIELVKFSFYYFLLLMSRKSIVFGSNFRNGDFDGFSLLKVP